MTFWEILTKAVGDLVAHGYDRESRLNEWMERLKDAAIDELGPLSESVEKLRAALRGVYGRQTTSGAILKAHPGIEKITLQMIEPQLRSVLDRRIMASADLIKLNREQAIQKTLQRFSGWATSIPAGGSSVVDRNEVKRHIAKSLQSSTFEERRLAIDQGHKLIANISAVLAEQTGAIAAKWRHVHQAGYDGRPEHEARDGVWFVIRDSWAAKKGLMKPGPYSDAMDQPSEAPYCRCWWEYADALTDVPDELLTKAGRDAKHLTD